MSKIMVEFDTNDKTMTATVDGKALENVQGAHFYAGYGDDAEYCCELCTCDKDEENGVYTHTRVVASESDVGKEIEDFLVHEDLPGFKIVMDNAKADIQRTMDAAINTAVASYFGADGE